MVSESGYARREQLDELERIGVDAVLMGETLMRAGDPEALVRELTLDEEATREHYLERASDGRLRAAFLGPLKGLVRTS